MTVTAAFPDPRIEPIITVERAASYFGIQSRSAAYDAASRGDIPTRRFGRKLVVPTADLARQLGIRFEGLR